jgi:hypothetical protein
MCFWHGLLLLYLAYRKAKNKRVWKKHSRYQKDFFISLSIEEHCQQCQKISQCALVPLKLSPWQKLLALQNDQAYVTMMGSNCKSFSKILEKFAPVLSGHMPSDKSGMIVQFKYTRGQKREVQTKDCLGLVLVWMCTRGLLNVLQLVFGLTYTNLFVYLIFGICLIIKTFSKDLLARVAIPSMDEIE